MHQEVITPELLPVLQQADDNITFIADHADYMAHIYAMFLLAQFREKRALPLVIKLFSHPGDISDHIADDFICEDLPRVLASLYDGDITPITHLIENSTVNEYVRSSGLHALVILVVNDMKSREDIVEYFTILYRDKLQRTPSMLWDSLVYCSCMLHAQEV